MFGIDTIFYIYNLVLFILVWFWWAILLVYIIFMKLIMRKWPLEAIIFEKRGENLIKTNDRAGKYLDPYTNITGYKLQKAGDTIPVLDFDWIMHNVYKPTTILERFVALLRGNLGTIFLFRYGSKQYKPIKITQNKKVKTVFKEILDKNGNPVFVKVYKPLDPRNRLGQLDFEVVDWDNMNFMVQEQRASITRRTKKGEFLKQVVVPLAMIGVALVFVIIMIKYGYDFAMSLKGSHPQQNEASQQSNAQPPNIPIINKIMPGE